MRHEAEIQQQAIAETPCTETAPCFACLRCFVTLTNILATDPNVRAHMTGVETRPAWKPAWKHAAEADGLLPSADAYRVGPLSAERTITLTAPHVATLPTGERVELPAGTVLREGAGGLDHRHLLACARGVVDFATHEPIDGPLMRALLSTLRAACGDSIEDVALRAGPPAAAAQAAKAAGARRHWVTSEGYTQLPPEMCKKLGLDKAGGHVWFLPDEQGPAWKAWKEEDLGAVFGERGSDLTERVGLPREMAPTVEPDPIAALTLAAYSATLAGLDRGTSAKAGVAALMSAYTAGVERAIADYAKETR